MKETLCSNGAKLLGLAILIFGVAQVSHLPMLYQVSYLLVVLVVICYLLTWSRLHKLEVTRTAASDRVQVGQSIQETFCATNHSILPKPWLEIYDYSDLPGHHAGQVVNLDSRGTKRWSLASTCYRRGKYQLGPVRVTSSDPLGLFTAQRPVVDGKEITVLPATVDLAGFCLPAGDWQEGKQNRFKFHAVTPSVSTVRDYRPGDSFNKISWTHTARAQKLMVKEFEFDPTPDHWIVLDMDKSVHVVAAGTELRLGSTIEAGLVQSTEEYAVTAAASLAKHLLTDRRGVGLVTWAQEHYRLPSDRGERQFAKIMDALAVVRAEGTSPLREIIAAESSNLRRGDNLLIVTPSTEEAWVYSLRHLVERGVRVSAVVVEPSTFGAEESSLMVVGALASVGVPSYLVKRGFSVADALVSGAIAVRRIR
jgi:uncharacterized protein (DUF58 family)